MKITMQEATDAASVLRPLLTEKMPVKLAMQVRRLVRQITPVLEDFDAERQKLIALYAQQENDRPKQDAAGNILLADAEAFHVGYRELLAVEHEVDAGLNMGALEESGIEISPAALMGLGPLLVE